MAIATQNLVAWTRGAKGGVRGRLEFSSLRIKIPGSRSSPDSEVDIIYKYCIHVRRSTEYRPVLHTAYCIGYDKMH